MTAWPYPGPEGLSIDLHLPKGVRVAAQRALRAEQYRIVAELDAYRDVDGRAYSAQEPARYRDSRGWLGVDRYIQSCLRQRRASRRAPPHTPWGTLLRDWTPERRCARAFAVDASGQVVRHDAPSAVRWCLAGWLAHRCDSDRDARRLLDEVWALLPEPTRSAVERIRRARLAAPERKRLDQHPLGYWWFLAPHLAERWLQITPSAELAPQTVRSP